MSWPAFVIAQVGGVVHGSVLQLHPWRDEGFMSEIKRYEPINIDGTCGLCVEDPDGAYADYSHLAALQAELAALKRQGREVDLMEPVYQFQWREIGEGDWMACSNSWFRFCEASPELDTRVVEVDRPAQTEQQPAYVECRECTDCGHVGINDAHPTDATCAMCDWSGPSPVEDQCPDCGKENAMGAACPKCSGRYRILAETHVAAPIAQTAPQPEQSGLVEALEELLAGTGTSPGANKRYGKARAALDAYRAALSAQGTNP